MKLTLSCAALLLFAAAAWAELGSVSGRHTRGPALLKAGVGVRALALGNAYVGLADDASALAWNPAALGQIQRPEALFQHESALDIQTTDFAGVVLPRWRHGRRTWGLAGAHRASKAFDLVEEDLSVGRARPSESMASISYAWPWGAINAGLTAKWVAQETFEDFAQTGAVDLGLFSAGRAFRWGVAIANLGPPLHPNGAQLPTAARAGASGELFPWKSSHWAGRLLGTAEVDVAADDKPTYHGGLECSLPLGGSEAALRAGYQSGGRSGLGGLALGFGWQTGAIGLNYAYAPSGEGEAIHRFDVGWRFGSALPQEARRNELWRLTQDSVQKENWLEARQKLSEIRALDPSFHPARKLAVTVEKRLAHSLDPETLYLLGHAALEAGRYEEAVEYFQRRLFIDPDHAQAREDLNRAERELTAQRKARLEERLARERAHLAQEARRLSEAGQWEPALEFWERLAAVDEGKARVGLEQARGKVYDLAVAAERAGDSGTAVRLFRRLGKKGPYRDSAARRSAVEASLAVRSRELYDAGLVAYKQGDRTGALALFQKALALDPANEAARRALERVEKDGP